MKIDKYWTSSKGDKYLLEYCSLCEEWIICCSDCSGSSCNGTGCKHCSEVFKEFSKYLTSFKNYLTSQELKTFEKIDRLKRLHIPTSLEAGFKTVNWEWLHKNGELAYIDYELFDLDFDKDEF